MSCVFAASLLLIAENWCNWYGNRLVNQHRGITLDVYAHVLQGSERVVAERFAALLPRDDNWPSFPSSSEEAGTFHVSQLARVNASR